MNFPDLALSFRDFAVCVLLVILILVAVSNGPTDPPRPQPASGYACPATIPHPHLPEDHLEDRPPCDGYRPGLTGAVCRGDPLTMGQRLEDAQRRAGEIAFDAVMAQGIGE